MIYRPFSLFGLSLKWKHNTTCIITVPLHALGVQVWPLSRGRSSPPVRLSPSDSPETLWTGWESLEWKAFSGGEEEPESFSINKEEWIHKVFVFSGQMLWENHGGDEELSGSSADHCRGKKHQIKPPDVKSAIRFGPLRSRWAWLFSVFVLVVVRHRCCSMTLCSTGPWTLWKRSIYSTTSSRSSMQRLAPLWGETITTVNPGEPKKGCENKLI